MIAAGTRLGRYEVRSKLGEGGMGEVYLAEDTRLRRNVALKILPADLASHKDRMRRFEQEAQAAAALNHPNIAHIYEIGDSDAVHFIAMELVDGVTLRQLIHEQQSELSKLLRHLQHVAEGLAKAHAAGIVHRDLKPDNIMVTRDAHAKILDFGLAKLIEGPGERETGRGGEEDPTIALSPRPPVSPSHSTPGAVMGTVGYMSPEQAQGRVNEIDHRSDIFSFGCILFEAATGHKPFAGKDALDSLHNIVHAPTPQIKDLNPIAPDELQRIVRRCLAKDPDKRYQSIKEVAIEIEELREQLKHSPETSESPHRVSSTAIPTGTVSAQSTTSQPTVVQPQSPASTSSSSQILISEIKRHKTGVLVTAALAIIVIAAAGYGIYKLVRSPAANVGPSQMKISALTTGGRVGNALIDGETAISADGKYVVFVTTEAGKQALWIRQISTSSLVQIAPPSDGLYLGTALSPDGELVYFTRLDEVDPLGAVYQVPVLGGTPRKVLGDCNSAVTFSPDGKRFAFIRYAPQQGESYLMLANVDGSGEQKLATRKEPEFFSVYGSSWSPDGKLIACAVSTNGGAAPTGIAPAELIAVPISGGADQILSSEKFPFIYHVLWLPDATGLVFIADTENSLDGRAQIFLASYPSGQIRRITNDLNTYGHTSLGLTADGNTLVTSQSDFSAQILVMDVNKDSTQAVRVSNGKYDGIGGLAWTPDNQIIYLTQVGQSIDLWLMNADGTNQKQLTVDGGFKELPSVSPDGRYVVFAGSRSGSTNLRLWRMDIDGNNLKELLPQNTLAFYPTMSRDGSLVLFNSNKDGNVRIWKTSIDGGEPQQMTDGLSMFPAISPDGSQLAFFTLDAATGGKPKIMIVPFGGQGETKSFALSPASNATIPTLMWTADGSALTYTDPLKGVDNIWSQPIDGKPRKALTNFKQDHVFAFAWSRDGKRLAVSHGPTTTDVVLIKDFR